MTIRRRKVTTYRIMNTLNQFGRDALRSMYRKDCCIDDATAVVCDFLIHFGFKPRPMHCDLTIVNAVGQQIQSELGRLPESVEEIAEWDRRKGKMIMIRTDNPPTEGGYPGHLVTLCKIDRELRLIDLTLNQCDRPDHGVQLPPLLACAPQDFCRGNVPTSYDIDGCFVGYVAYPKHKDFLKTPAWLSPRREPLVRTLIRIAKGK